MAYLIGISVAIPLNRIYVFRYSDQSLQHEVLWLFSLASQHFPSSGRFLMRLETAC
jgi:hypothetical protein